MEAAITLGYYISSIGFLLAAILMAIAAGKFGKSTLGAVLSYLFVGTATFFVVTIFQKLGSGFFGISDDSMDVWWHLMFYLALFSYYFALKTLVGLGSADPATSQKVFVSPKAWGIFTGVVLVGIFTVAGSAEPLIAGYNASNVAQLGLHHFLAFILAGIIGSYLLNAKKNLGQIGQAIANPMIIGIWALGAQHFWEILFESWKWVAVSSETGEGVERIFLVITSACIIYSAWRLKSFSQR